MWRLHEDILWPNCSSAVSSVLPQCRLHLCGLPCKTLRRLLRPTILTLFPLLLGMNLLLLSSSFLCPWQALLLQLYPSLTSHFPAWSTLPLPFSDSSSGVGLHPASPSVKPSLTSTDRNNPNVFSKSSCLLWSFGLHHPHIEGYECKPCIAPELVGKAEISNMKLENKVFDFCYLSSIKSWAMLTSLIVDLVIPYFHLVLNRLFISSKSLKVTVYT